MENHHNKLFITGIMSVLVVIFVLLVAVAFKYQKNVNKPEVEKQTNTVQATGMMQVDLADKNQPVSTGDMVTVIVTANSYNNPISGFDTDLDLTSNLKFVKAESMNESFNVAPTVRDGGVIITGYKTLGTDTVDIFKKSAIVRVTLEAVATGKASVQPVVDIGAKTKSNLIDRQNNNILNIVKGTSFEIK